MEWILSLLRGEPRWPPGGIDEDSAKSILAAADANGVRELLVAAARNSVLWEQIPERLRERLTLSGRLAAVHEVFLGEEIKKDLAALTSYGFDHLLLKGTALAYRLYPSPELRPRCDVDLLVRDKKTAEQAWHVLRELGYHRPAAISGDLISHQFSCLRKMTEGSGVALDVHWRLSNSNFFAQKFTFDELKSERIPVRRLGPDAFCLSLRHTLLHALFHRVRHLGAGDPERLIWLYDIDLICRHLTRQQWDDFAELALERDLVPICRDGLERAQGLYRTPIPDGLFDRIETEKSKSYRQLALKEPSYRGILFEIQSIPTPSQRLRYLRETVFPDRRYMEQRFGITGNASLALAYLRRIWRRAVRRSSVEPRSTESEP